MVGLKVCGIVMLAFLYLVSPIDIVPDVIPVLGWADDLAALLAEKKYHDIKSERDYGGVIRFLFGRY